MVLFTSKHIGLSFLLASASVHEISAATCQSRRLTYPKIVDLDEIAYSDEAFTLDIEWMEVDPGFSDADGSDNSIDAENCGSTPFMTRALGGSVPGPTLTVSPGTTLRIKFNNKLTYQPESYSSRFVVEQNGELKTTTENNLSRLNKFNDPDIANLHFHGLHISGILPSDDTTLEVLPQESFEYVLNIPEDHEPGMHWVHPHHHGSSTLQLVGGAALAMIVKDTEDALFDDALDGNFSHHVLPPDVVEAPERIHIFQDWDFTEALQTARHANDLLITESFNTIRAGRSIGQRFVTVNGKYQPITEIKAGKWERWRFLYAGWQDLPLEFGINYEEENGADCEFYLLAKDGIYLSDYPRGPMLTTDTKPLPIPPGGRADFMVRCNKPGGTTRFEALSRSNVLTVNCVENDEIMTGISTSSASERSMDRTPLMSWDYDIEAVPEYLQSVMDQNASAGCSCGTEFDGYDDTSRVNGNIYRPGNNFIHTSYLGAVVERNLKGMHEHSYHQHVYPYQLVDFPEQGGNETNQYFKIGDWHDTYLDKSQKGGAKVTIRYKTTDIPGKIMVHCHNTLHADNGMIQKEYVRNVTDVGCQCEIFGSINGAGIVDDINSPKVIGGIPPVPRDPEPVVEDSASFIGFAMLLPALMAGVSMALL